MTVKVKITVKNAVSEESSATAYRVFDWEFGLHSHEWSCSHPGTGLSLARDGGGPNEADGLLLLLAS